MRLITLALGLVLSACTRTLQMPMPEMLPSPAGPMVDFAPVKDERASPRLGKLDTLTIHSGPDLPEHVEAELINGLARMGFSVRQVDETIAPTSGKRLQVSLLSAELASESTALQPVVASIRFRVELVNEFGDSGFRKEFRGATSRKLGFHTQGGPEDSQVLSEAINQAVEGLVADGSFAAALTSSRDDAPQPRVTTTDREPSAPGAGPSTSEAAQSAAERLATLDQLLKEGLITPDDHETKRREILDGL